MFNEKAVALVGKVLSAAIDHPYLTTAVVVSPWIADKIYKATMLSSQLRENNDREVLERIAENTTQKDIGKQKNFLTKELL
jgi:hypothetical protein